MVQADSSHSGALRHTGVGLSPVHRTALRGGEGGATSGLRDRAGLDVVQPVKFGLEVKNMTLKDELPSELSLVG